MTDPQVHQSLEQMLGADALARLELSTESASSLPNAAYTSEAFLLLENQRLFTRTWILAGIGAQIPRPGDIVPTAVAGQPLILVRGQEGDVRAFHNVCRHRGTRLVSAPCSGRKTIVCPYHSWTYDLGGQLLKRPHFNGGGKHDHCENVDQALSLAPVHAAQWQDLIFVNISGDAPQLETHLKPMIDRMAGYDLSALRFAGTISYEINANWKFVHENFMENYHVFALHPKLHAFVPMELRQPTLFDGPCFWNEYRFPKPEQGRGDGLPYYPNLAEDLRQRGLWFHFFPTVGIELWPDQFAVFQVTPISPDRTREDIHIYLIGEAAESDAYRDARQNVFDMWHELNDEDVGILEKLQQGRHSASYTGGRFSSYWEQCNHHFSQLIVQGIRR
ncbi:MAG: aromatic ring-hydroxylating dioxygenase subunit alpha [Gammaproteobacteria bacterium]|nr:aromatic ring-hydroxylating dioxygenase subunit alpha [Gammaproteobacteria bacterium]